MRRTLLLFVKCPEPGKVKTRLAAEIGKQEASDAYRQLTETVCASMPIDVEQVVMFDPPEQRAAIEAWLSEKLPMARFEPQSAGDLGRRLTAAFDQAFDGGAQQVAAIGSDCVELSAPIYQEAWRA